MLPRHCCPTELVLTLGATYHLERVNRNYLGALQAFRDLLKWLHVTEACSGPEPWRGLGGASRPCRLGG